MTDGISSLDKKDLVKLARSQQRLLTEMADKLKSNYYTLTEMDGSIKKAGNVEELKSIVIGFLRPSHGGTKKLLGRYARLTAYKEFLDD